MIDINQDRRALARVKIKGAEVSYRYTREMKIIKRFSGPQPMEDLTWTSIRFTTDQMLPLGEILDVEIAIPGEKKVRVRGYVIWRSDTPNHNKHYAVVQFIAYGTGKPFNPIKIKEKLQQIVNKYSRIIH